MMDQEFDSKGLLKEKTFFIRSDDQEAQPKNLFVIDVSKKLQRGNIVIGNNAYVIVSPELVFKNGQPIKIEELAIQLQKSFGVSSSQSFSAQIEKLWEKQNQSINSVKTPQTVNSVK
jgi:hypothetical protein